MPHTRLAATKLDESQQVQCPYTATTCPLFAPVFTEQETRTNVSTVPLSYSDYSLTPSAPAPPLHNFCASAHGNSAPRAPSQYSQASYEGPQGDFQNVYQEPNRSAIHRNYSGESASSVTSQEPRAPPPAPYAPRPAYAGTSNSYDSRWSGGGDSCRIGSGSGSTPGQGQDDSRSLDMEDMLGGFRGGRTELGGRPEFPKPREPSFEPVETEPLSSSSSTEAVTPFISKLSHLLNHSDYQHYIRWNRQGTAFIFAHTSPELLNIFSRFFRHSNSNSFVRQLNIYGFTRLTTLELLSAVDDHSFSETNFSAGDFSGFHHPLFFRDTADHLCDLGKIKPKVTAKKWAAKKAVSEGGAGGGGARSKSLKGEGKTGGNVKRA